MKVLMCSVYFLIPVMERELEIATNHCDDGDEVFFFRCRRQLHSCLLNPKHRKSICYYCMGKYNEGFRIAGLPSRCIRVLPPSPKSYPEIPDEFQDVDELMNFTYDGADLGMSVYSSCIFPENFS